MTPTLSQLRTPKLALRTCHEIDADGNIDIRGRGRFRASPDDAAVHRRRQAETGDDRSDPAGAADPGRYRQCDGAGASVRRSSRIWPGSASITAPSPAKSASAWSPPSRNSRRPAAASRPACSIRRSAACSPRPRSGGRTMSAGRSSPIPAPGRGSACRPSWCRSNPATPTAPNGVPPPAPSRFSWRGARKPTPPPRNSPSGKRRSPPGAPSTTPWSSRISSCCRACRA